MDEDDNGKFRPERVNVGQGADVLRAPLRLLILKMFKATNVILDTLYYILGLPFLIRQYLLVLHTGGYITLNNVLFRVEQLSTMKMWLTKELFAKLRNLNLAHTKQVHLTHTKR